MSLDVRGLWSLKLATKVLPLAVILLQVFNFGFGSNKTVHVIYSSGHFSVSQLPDDLDVTISVQNSTWAVLHLRRVPHITLDIPMYTLGVDASGKPVQTKVDLEKKMIVGYYQDLTREAVIQITRTNDINETSAQYKIEGVLEVAGLRHSILPDNHPRYRRDLTSANSSSSEEDLYILEVVDQPTTGTLSDYLDPPPNIEVSKREDSLSSALGSAQGPSTTLSPSDITKLEGEATSSLSETSSTSGRQRREAPLDIFLDIVAVTDFAVYNRYLTAAKGDKNQALSALRMWYAFVFNGIDLRYQGIHSSEYNINVRLVKLILSESLADAPFTEPFKTPGSHWDTLSAPSALEGIAEFAKKHDLLRSDHVMLMTGYDLTTAGSTTTTGLAYTATLCAGNEMQFSVVEDLGGYQTVETAAHELGHGLGARHDGDGNSCPSTDRYIMAGSSYAVTDSNRLNPWRFSQCSIQAMTSHIKTNLAKPNGKRCLIQSEAVVSSLPDVSQYMPGEVYSPDQQCRNQYGNESRYCRGTEFGNVSTICTSMFCYDPVTGSKGICFEEKAAQGTTCGSEKQCIDGACVYVPNSPQVDETCAYGDQPGVAFNGKTCRQFVSGHPGYCYQTVVRTRCCASCQDFYRPFKDCEYGNKYPYCTNDSCDSTKGEAENCCETCNIGEPLNVSSSTSVRPPSREVTTPAPKPKAEISGQCADNPGVLVNNMSCTTASIMNPEYCYQEKMMLNCCASCRRANSGIIGCEYGDKNPVACKSSKCAGLAVDCCYTCGSRNSSPLIHCHVFLVAVLSLLTISVTLVISQ